MLEPPLQIPFFNIMITIKYELIILFSFIIIILYKNINNIIIVY